MKKFGLSALALSVVVLVSQQAWAQRPGGGRGGFGDFGRSKLMLLSQTSVQEELKLADDQLKKVTDLGEKQRASFGELQGLSREERQAKFEEMRKASDTAVAEVLKEDQLKRLNQISLQLRGARAFADPEIAEKLALTADQKSQLQAIEDAAMEEMRKLGEEGADREEMREKFEELRKSGNEKAQAMLSSEQQAKWKELTGAPFKGEIRRGEFGGGRRGNGGASRPGA